MIRAARFALALGLAAAPAGAGEPTAEVWQLFARLCPAVVAAPAAAQVPVALVGASVKIGGTSDGWSLMGAATLPGAPEGVDGLSLVFGEERVAEGRAAYCQVQALGTEVPVEALETQIAAGAEAVLGGPVTVYGGPFRGDVPGPLLVKIYRTAGWPPSAQIRFQVMRGVAILAMHRYDRAEGN